MQIPTVLLTCQAPDVEASVQVTDIQQLLPIDTFFATGENVRMETSQDVGEALGGRIRARYGATVLIGSSLLALLLLSGAFCVWAWGPDELEQKAEQVQLGMAENEVKAILGKPVCAVLHHAGPPVQTRDVGPPVQLHIEEGEQWETDRCTTTVWYSDGKVNRKEVHRTPLWDRIRAKLPW